MLVPPWKTGIALGATEQGHVVSFKGKHLLGEWVGGWAGG